jgi:translation initiation factor IF-1
MKKASALESKRRGRLVKIATGDLLSLERELRKLQEPHGRVFWRIEQLIGRIDDELNRRTT